MTADRIQTGDEVHIRFQQGATLDGIAWRELDGSIAVGPLTVITADGAWHKDATEWEIRWFGSRPRGEFG